MHNLAFVPHLGGFEVHPLRIDADQVELRVVAVQPQAACPVCHQVSWRVHSHYERCVGDLPWNHARVLLRVQARRFRCLVAHCSRRIFCERLPALVAVYARRTAGLTALLQAVGLALGGRPGRRLIGRLPLVTSRTTLLRLVRRIPDPPPSRIPRVLSVDEWSYRRGRQYGTILVDLERRQVIDLLPEAAAGTLARWLRAHPGVQIISRDRSGPFAKAAAKARSRRCARVG
jgi:transposase